MRIAYILPSLTNTGPIIVVNNLVSVLKKWGCIIDVYYFDELPSMDFACPTIRISMNTYIDFNKYDIIHSHCLRPDKYVIKWKNKTHKSKFISTIHQDTYCSFRFQYNRFLSYLLTKYWCHLHSKFDGVISISEQLNRSYSTLIKSPITTIYNGCILNEDCSIDRNIVEKISELKRYYKILGTYALVTRRKGLEQIIQVLPLLQDYVFIIIGEGPDIERLKLLSQKMNVLDRVLFFPYQKNPCNYLSYFDVYVMPSYSEGFGLSMVEGALAKKAIVCSDIPSFKEIFPNNEACLFDLDNIASLWKAITTAYENKEKYGELAYMRASSRFTIYNMAENHLKYYQNII